MNKHDGSYRLLFRNPHLVRDLFDGIVSEHWVTLLDWSGLTPLASNYISDALRQRHGDLIWRVPRHDGEDLFVLLMLEHQSTNDRTMALRIATYCCLLYEDLLARKLVSRRGMLPILLPIVMYSGVGQWSAPLSMDGLIDAAPLALAPYIPGMRYLLVHEGEHVRTGDLPADNFASLLFRLEHNRGIDDVQDLMQTIWNRTHAPEFSELRRAFATWTRHVLLPRALPDIVVPTVDDLLEIKTMLNEHSRSWTHQWKAEGLEEGLTKGRREGGGAVLQRQLVRKFGRLSSDVQKRLNEATPEQLEVWSLNVLDALSINEVFTD